MRSKDFKGAAERLGVFFVGGHSQPENILLVQEQGQTDFVKLLDFGLARIMDQVALTRPEDGPAGTLWYMAPELWQSAQPSPAIDMYALGVVLYELIAGEIPFTGTDVEIISGHIKKVPAKLAVRRPDLNIPRELEDLVARLLQKPPRLRPTAEQTASELMAIRPRLPPRSARSIQFLQTYVLGERGQPGATGAASVHEAQTYVLDKNRPELARTLQFQPILRELDQVESELELTGAQLAGQAEALFRKRWPQPSEIPAELARTHAELSDAEKAEEDQGVHLAILREQVAEQQEARRARRAALHRELLDLRAIVRAEKNRESDQHRERVATLIDMERAYAAPADKSPESDQLAHDQPRLQAARDKVQRMRQAFAEQVLRACPRRPQDPSEPGPGPGQGQGQTQAANQGIEQLRRTLEAALQKYVRGRATLSTLIERLPDMNS